MIQTMSKRALPCVACRTGRRRLRLNIPLTLLQDIANIFYCSCSNKGGRGGCILRNIVGNKGGLGGGQCTIMCDNAPFSVSRTIFYLRRSDTSTHLNSEPKKTKHSSKYLKNTSKFGGGAITGNVVQYIAQQRGCLQKILLCK